MKRLHLFIFLSSVTSLFAGALIACSSDDTIVTYDVAPDASPDADKRIPETDTGTDLPDAGPDVVDFDAGLKIETYPEAIAETLCNALTRCCFGNANVPDGGAVDGGDAGAGFFDREECLNLYDTLGFERSNVGLKVTRKNIVLDQAKGADCISKINSLACNLDGASLKTIRAACYGAFQGQLSNGDQCSASVECASGSFCLGSGSVQDGGFVGICTPLRTQGQSCSIQSTGSNSADAIAGEEACSHRGGGGTELACASYDLVTGKYKADRSSWTCQPVLANGAICSTSVSCANGICDPGPDLKKYTCEPVLTYFNRFSCSAHIDP